VSEAEGRSGGSGGGRLRFRSHEPVVLAVRGLAGWVTWVGLGMQQLILRW
jgi:hypothetical protein